MHGGVDFERALTIVIGLESFPGFKLLSQRLQLLALVQWRPPDQKFFSNCQSLFPCSRRSLKSACGFRLRLLFPSAKSARMPSLPGRWLLTSTSLTPARCKHRDS
jgi:hypothetical protein